MSRIEIEFRCVNSDFGGTHDDLRRQKQLHAELQKLPGIEAELQDFSHYMDKGGIQRALVVHTTPKLHGQVKRLGKKFGFDIDLVRPKLENKAKREAVGKFVDQLVELKMSKHARPYQQGLCGTYAIALTRLRPDLKIGIAGTRWNPDDENPDWVGWDADHYFAHDNKHVYDSLGKRPLPLISGIGDFKHGKPAQPLKGWGEGFDHFELGHDPKQWEYLADDEAGPEGGEAGIQKAIKHIRKHGILK